MIDRNESDAYFYRQNLPANEIAREAVFGATSPDPEVPAMIHLARFIDSIFNLLSHYLSLVDRLR